MHKNWQSGGVGWGVGGCWKKYFPYRRFSPEQKEDVKDLKQSNISFFSRDSLKPLLSRLISQDIFHKLKHFEFEKRKNLYLPRKKSFKK